MARIARIVEIDYPHHVVERGNNKQQVFFDENDRRLYIRLLRKYSAQCKCAVNAYCLMLNHVHMLLTPLVKGALSKTMQKLSLRYTQHINAKYGRTGRLWECRFYSSLIQKDSYLLAACRYVERNPVRAGIAHRPEQYEWSSAGARQSGIMYDFVKPIWNNEGEKGEYMNYLNMPEEQSELSKIRRSAKKGIPLASEEFIQHISAKYGIRMPSEFRGRPIRNEERNGDTSQLSVLMMK